MCFEGFVIFHTLLYVASHSSNVREGVKLQVDPQINLDKFNNGGNCKLQGDFSF
jgi:hypothetical protein